MIKYIVQLMLVVWLASATFVSVAGGQWCTTIKYPAPSGSKNDIEFEFDKPYSCGKFANGDWWVSADSDEGVMIVAIKPSAYGGLNGFEINPSSKVKQAFDHRIAGYDAKVMPMLPLNLKLSDYSVVKAVSISSTKGNCRPCLQYAAVLTITRNPVLDSDLVFRPGYAGTSKQFLRLENLNVEKLGKLPSSSIPEKSHYPVNSLAKRFQGVQLDHIEGWVGRSLHPIDIMPDYGADIARDNAVAILRLLLDDFDIHNKQHIRALVNYLQMSIDLRAMADSGVRWPPNGGHGNGRKLPILFGGLVFNDPGFLRAAKNATFSEDGQVYYSPISNRALYGRKCSDAGYWMTMRFGKGPRDCRDPYGYIDGGGHEIGEAYQKCCTAKPWKYTALAVELLRIQDLWQNDAFMQYVDRWVRDGVWARPDPCAPFNGNPADYGGKYGVASGKSCVPGVGRHPDKHGINKDTGYYDNRFAEQMWNTFKPAK